MKFWPKAVHVPLEFTHLGRNFTSGIKIRPYLIDGERLPAATP